MEETKDLEDPAAIYCMVLVLFNSLPNDKILDQSNSKAFTDDNLCAVQLMICLPVWVENIAGYQHFLLFLQCFQKASFPASLKVGIVW